MVSLWPWRGDDSSPASFERALSTLAGKISKNSTQLNSLRQRSRRLKALWTLYAGFAYILCALILGLVVGWRKWGPVEYSAVAGGPVLIYLVRLSVDTYYNYRISTVAARLDDLQRERDKTIEKLKASTRYNTTQQLLEKYGGSSPQAGSTPGSGKKRRPANQESPSTTSATAGEKRVSIVPPPTANIPRNRPLISSPSTPQQNIPSPATPLRQQLPSSEPEPGVPPQSPQDTLPGPPEFAPNAFMEPPQYAARPDASQSHWYDRLLDILLGDDETLPKNRLALICSHCKLVNGQAPPGVKDLADVGRWRCGGCGGWNGEEESARKMVHEIKQQQQQQVQQGKLKQRVSKREKMKPEVADSAEEPSLENFEEQQLEDEDSNEDVSDDVISEGKFVEEESGQLMDRDDQLGEDEIPSPPASKPKRGRPVGSGKRKA